MKTLWITSAALIGLAVFTGGRLNAQAPVVRAPGSVPNLPPPYSPYLNLLRNGNPTYINYYGLVRPEQDFRNGINNLQQGVAANSAAITQTDQATGLPLTGHPTQFMNTSHYFLNRGGQGSPGTAPAASPPRAATSPVHPPH